MKNINKKDADPIYEKGKIGQIAVLDRVEFSKDDKMREFEQPHLFRILSKEGEGYDTVYEMESLVNGEKVKINHRDFSYFYDASEWAHKMRDEKETQKNEASKRIEELKDKITMLADILIRQGNKVVVVTKEGQESLKKIGIIN